MVCAILNKELDHLQILESAGILEPIPFGYRGTSVLGESKVIHTVLTALGKWGESVPLTPMFLKGRLYLHLGEENRGL